MVPITMITAKALRSSRDRRSCDTIERGLTSPTPQDLVEYELLQKRRESDKVMSSPHKVVAGLANRLATHDNSVIIEEAIMHSSGTDREDVVTLNSPLNRGSGKNLVLISD